MFFTILGVIVAILIVGSCLGCVINFALDISHYTYMDREDRISYSFALCVFLATGAAFAYPLFCDFPFNITFSLAMVK